MQYIDPEKLLYELTGWLANPNNAGQEWSKAVQVTDNKNVKGFGISVKFIRKNQPGSFSYEVNQSWSNP